ncbi:DUF3078 domain-containing protein [Crocinitomix catalasitica]|uniref:DUF3078 domain-containing protein n=1 Tax=Crocinitomix catalasitica TaxID=184607 RepID=UPI00048954E1|nr:DUF3078 domain-containing protein [Crocinitomix catalasitica]
MKKLLFAIIAFGSVVSFGQVTEGEETLVKENTDTLDGWKKGGYFSLNGTQVSLTNWVAGGENSVSVNGLFGLYANLVKGSNTWENNFTMGYGLMKQSSELFGSSGGKWIKTDDRIDITSKYGRRASKSWYYAALMNFRTQSTAGYDYAVDDVTEISGFMAPGYFLTAIGMDYKPNDNFSLFIAPITSKLTFVNDQTLADAGSFGVDKAFTDENGTFVEGKRFRSEFGGYLRMTYKVKLAPNISFQTKADVFSNYLNNPERLDVSWENLIEIKLWKFLSATISTHLIYDDDINISIYNDVDNPTVATGSGPRVQFKEVFGLGLSWKIDQ